MSKEQKGKNAVLVIAVGKNPKMGPGKRDYKNDKAMKKAFSLLKNDSKRKEREARFKERKARREERAKEQAAYNEGTASDEVRQKIDASKEKTESGVNQNLRFADKNTGGSQQRRMPKKNQQKPPFDTSNFDRWVQNYSLSQKGTDRISSENAMELAHRTGIKINDIQSKNFDGYDIGALKQAMNAIGKENYEKRQESRERKTTGVGRNEQDDTEPEPNYDLDGDNNVNTPPADDGENKLDSVKRIAMARGLTVQQVQDMMLGEERYGEGDEGEQNERGDVSEGEDSQMRNAPSSVFTTPYATREGAGFKSGTARNPSGVGRSTGSQFKTNTSVEDTMHGFKPPVSYDLSRVGDNPLDEEEANMDDVEDLMSQKAEPMELAFQLLKQSMCKGSNCDGCDKCKCKGGDKCKCSKCC